MKKEEVDNLGLQGAILYAMEKLVQQGIQSVNEEGCVYGNDQEHHCMVGWLLDETNPKLMHCKDAVGGLCEFYPKDVPEIIKSNIPLFRLLQRFHDEPFKKERNDYLNQLKKLYPDTDFTSPLFEQWVNLAVEG